MTAKETLLPRPGTDALVKSLGEVQFANMTEALCVLGIPAAGVAAPVSALTPLPAKWLFAPVMLTA